MPSLEEIAEEIYGGEASSIVKSFDLIGDIIIIKIPKELLDERRFILAEKILDSFPYVKVVYRQVGKVGGSYRVRRLEHLAGEKRSLTLYKEYGSRFWVDVEKVYFSPRLSYERSRIASKISRNERILNMFAGVGPFSIHCAKRGGYVYSVDINPYAISLHLINNRLNKVWDRIETYLGDAAEHASRVTGVDRVLMPLPELALNYLPYALEALDGEGWIHIYLHIEYGEDEEEALAKAEEIVANEVERLGYEADEMGSRVVREVAVRTAQVVVDLHVYRRRNYL